MYSSLAQENVMKMGGEWHLYAALACWSTFSWSDTPEIAQCQPQGAYKNLPA